MYIFSVITTLLITNITRISEPRTEKISDIICNLFILQDFVGGKSVNIVYWTLTLEICFYIIMLIIYKLKAVKYIDIICGFWILLILMDVGTAYMAWDTHPTLNYSLLTNYEINGFNFAYPNPIGALTFPNLSLSVANIIGSFKDFIKTKFILMQGRAVFFIAGIMLYQLKIMGFSWYRITIIGLCILAKAFDYASDAHSYVSIFFTVYILIIYLAISDRLQILAVKPFVFLGSTSYALYLTHLQVSWLLKFAFVDLAPEISIIIKVLIAIVVASFLTFTIEIPAMKFIKLFYQKRLGENAS